MVKPEACDKSNIIRGDKPVKMLLIEFCKLGNPSSQIDTFLKTGKRSHGAPLSKDLLSVKQPSGKTDF